MSGPIVNFPPYYGQREQCGDLWELHKDGRRARCRLWTHPIGGEVRITVDGDFLRSEAGRAGVALVDLGLAWKAQFIEKGWA